MSPGNRSARLPGLRPEVLTDDQRALYETITGGRRAAGPQLVPLTDDDGSLRGPFNAMLLSPPVGDALQRLGVAVRYETALSDRQRELAILVVASEWRSDFEWAAHETIGRHVGLTDADLDAVRGGPPTSLDAAETAVVSLSRSLVTTGTVTDDEYAEAVSALGVRTVYELTVLVGYYAALALQLRVFAGDG